MELYKNGVNIEKSILEKILDLPRTTLLEDLEKVLEDSIYRFDFFSKKNIEEEWEEKWEESYSFPLHALLLMVELDAKEKLLTILNHFSERNDIIDFWYEDHKFETIWKFVYHLAQDDLEMLATFQKDKSLSRFPKEIICQAVTQIAHHQPERKAEVIQWYRDILNLFLENVEDSLLCDVGVVTQAISESGELYDESLLPLAKKCFDLNLVDLMFVGDYEEYESKMKENTERKIDLYENIFDHYQHIFKAWYGGHETKEERLAEVKEFEVRIAKLEKEKAVKEEELRSKPEELEAIKPSMQLQVQVKVGRNEPCPCGSGKKYKKCCL